jgi:regulator of Ty1 transposition protein 103
MQLRQGLGVGPVINGTGFSSRPVLNAPPSEQTSVLMQGSGVRTISPQLQPQDPATSNPATVVVGDEPKKTAAAMADKLASLEAPEEVLSSVFNKMKAEAASKNCGFPSGELSAGAPGFQLEKRPRIEKPTMPSDIGGTPPFFSQTPQVQQQIGGVPTSVGGTQQSTPANQALGLFPPTPPPLPSLLPPLLQQFAQNSGGMIGMGPFSLMPGSMPPPPPLSNILSAGFLGPSGPPLPAPPPPPPPPVPSAQSQPQQQSPQAPQISSTSAGFFQSSGIGFFPTVQHSPSVQRQ